jgi:hypothetical protein
LAATLVPGQLFPTEELREPLEAATLGSDQIAIRDIEPPRQLRSGFVDGPRREGHLLDGFDYHPLRVISGDRRHAAPTTDVIPPLPATRHAASAMHRVAVLAGDDTLEQIEAVG